ncbi:ParB/RepB/Spo0J family partition protein [Haloquadratum walsbyi]|uniref:Uncharacterized protein n=1 Tax=Haloquadratum walsbyi J07HQW2 TaxID=1238425 RepID=U1PNQ2_9EURY|nr:ParB/RepB/Spo0J family partition protein [Haloquadratum walsbyi]ERG93876.1 MAG: hypothetical protein J07HQW2_00310 [Haloquadratum walsbyi J07HQW2]
MVREDGTILNGHKRVAAVRVAGLDSHAVEVVSVSDELLALAHPQRAAGGEDEADGNSADDPEEQSPCMQGRTDASVPAILS